jgi:hypothetical protein
VPQRAGVNLVKRVQGHIFGVRRRSRVGPSARLIHNVGRPPLRRGLATPAFIRDEDDKRTTDAVDCESHGPVRRVARTWRLRSEEAQLRPTTVILVRAMGSTVLYLGLAGEG